MKKIVVPLMAMLSLCIVPHAQANDYEWNDDQLCCKEANNFYAKIFSGPNFLQTRTDGGIKTHYKTGYIVGGSLGYLFCNGMRVEAEYAFRRNSINKVHFFRRDFGMPGHFQSSSYMANLLWEPPLSNWGFECWNFHPYIGGGIGYDFQQIHGRHQGLVFNERNGDFAWQLIAGVGFPIFCNADFSLDYKFHQGGFKEIYSHSLEVGLAYRF